MWATRSILEAAALFLTFSLAFDLSTFSTFAAQSLGSSGTIRGTVTDPDHAAVKGAAVEIQNPVSRYRREAITDDTGSFEFTDVPFNPYHLSVVIPGFKTAQQDVPVRTSVPIALQIGLKIATATTTVTVQAEPGDLVEQTPTAHTDVDRSLIERLPIPNKSTGLSEVITNATPGIVADANGFFHPVGDHAQASISLDNQPINDQYSKIFSNQLSLDAIESLEVISGVAPPEYGDKTSLVINAVTRSGVGHPRPTGSFSTAYGSFGTGDAALTLGLGGNKVGNFLAASASGSSRFLDSPEFTPFHDKGNGETVFDRIDFLPTANDTLHLNLSASRSWFQTPNTYDQLTQDQKEQIRTLNIAPGWTHLFSPTTLLTFNPYFRLDHVQYFPSRDPLSDAPATIAQNRRLEVVGARADVSYNKGVHNAKAGVQFRHNVLTENFNLGVTDPTLNSACVDATGKAAGDPAIANPSQCPDPLKGNDQFSPGLAPFDLSRGGRLFGFRGHTDIKETAAYVQDSITFRGFTFLAGVRGDNYQGISQANQIEPRVGISYTVKPTTTVLRVSYGRFLETPYNENLVLSSSTGAGGLAQNVFGAVASRPLQSGRRNQFDVGIGQAFGRFVALDVDYFWKFTRNGFDFDNLFNTPIAFPIEWRKSKLDGVSARVNLTSIHGFTAYSVMAHTRARFFGPENGGLIFNSPTALPVFRIDHDQAFNQSTHLQYQFGHFGPFGHVEKNAPWVAFTWRYDSGLVTGGVKDVNDLTSLTGAQQAAIGAFCGSTVATLARPITTCASSSLGATRLRVPAAGKGNDDTNPARVAPRHLFDMAVGIDNLFHTDRPRVTLRLTAVNITNKVALYNFLSTFSGTHFVTPRVWQAELGLVF